MPSVAATIHLRLEDYYTSSILIGALAAQDDEPDIERLKAWSLEQGEDLAKAARKRWPR
jgi:hypothetical protein